MTPVNIIGLGRAATPAGLKAMDELEKLEQDKRRGRVPGPVRKKGVASNEMCPFLIINISLLQLISVNMIAYRSQYGSVNPAAVGRTRNRCYGGDYGSGGSGFMVERAETGQIWIEGTGEEVLVVADSSEKAYEAFEKTDF